MHRPMRWLRDWVEYHAAVSDDLIFDSLTLREMAKDRQLASPPKLNAAAGRFDFDLTDAPARFVR